MKSQIADMEIQIQVLSQKTSEITNNIKKVDGTLTDKKSKIKNLSNAQIAIDKLNFIFELPKKLRSNLNRNQIAKAIIYSSRATKLLERYTHMSAFHKIEKECQLISQEITTTIRSKLTDSVILM